MFVPVKFLFHIFKIQQQHLFKITTTNILVYLNIKQLQHNRFINRIIINKTK